MPKLIGKKRSTLEYVLIVLLIVYLGAMGLEFSVFNLRHWTTSFISPSTDAFLYEGYTIDRLRPDHDIFLPNQSTHQELFISNINHPIRTVYIRPSFGNTDVKMVGVTIRYLDQNRRSSTFTHIINGYTPSYHIPIGAMGDVDNMTIIIHDDRFTIEELHFNMPLPFRFQWVRVFLVTFIISMICFWKTFQFSKFIFNPKWGRQRLIDGGVVALFIGLLFFVMYFSVDSGFIPGQNREREWSPNRGGYTAINAMMVDALLMGQLHLDYEPHETLLNATNPHSITYRYTHGILAPWDHVFFEGKIYSYFGIVPVVLLFLPYYLIRSEHLSATAAVFFFLAIASVGIWFLWKAFAKKYLKDLPYTLFLAGLVGLLFGSNLLLPMVRPYQYEVVIASGLMFSVWGLYFIFRAVHDESYDRIKKRFIFIGGLFLALAVGSRPTTLFISLLVPVLMMPFIRSCLPLKNGFGGIKALKTNGLIILSLAAPYIVIGAGLAWYNFARFGSIFEFGASYQITNENVAVVTQTGVLGNLRRAFDGFFSYFFTSFNLRPHFPYVHATYSHVLFTGHFPRTAKIGAFMLPITWFIFSILYLRKKESAKKAMPIIKWFTLIGLLIAMLSTVLIGPLARYSVDFFWLIMFASMLCMGLVYKEAVKLGGGAAMFVRRFTFIAVGITCFIMFGWGMIGEVNFIWRHNPVVFRFLSDLFMIF